MNKVILMGRLTRDPEIRYSNAAEPLAIARYTLAVDRAISRARRDAGEQAADFINCTCFGRDAEFVEKFYRKGQMVSVVGRIQVRSYDDQQGQRRWTTDIITSEHFFAESRASFEGRGGGNDFNAPEGQGGYHSNSQPPAPAHNNPQPQQPQNSQVQTPSDSFFEIDNTMDDDDLPF